ncbi:DUF805 domain-containing protein [Curvivirga sp.]|uniref:DUF805 domain-containing protein n=1 Tax=Curvivirga sp. TaxID=2856848 RepID=UPI003B5CCB8A
MDILSILHATVTILVIVIILITIIYLPTFAVKNENSNKRTTRLNFLAWVLGYYSLPVFIKFNELEGASGVVTILLCYLGMFVLLYPFMQQYVRRARDAGWGKRIAFLSTIPIVNLVTTLILLLKRSEQAKSVRD